MKRWLWQLWRDEGGTVAATAWVWTPSRTPLLYSSGLATLSIE